MADLKLTVAQIAPEQNGAITLATGGGWSAGTFSFKVAAVYDGVTDIDNFGVIRTSVTNWENISVTAASKVVIPIKIETSRAFKFEVCFQSGATYDPSTPGTRIAAAYRTYTQAEATEYTITLTANSSSPGTLTFGVLPSSMSLSAPVTLSWEPRQMSIRDAFGNTTQITYMADRLIDKIIASYSTTQSIKTTDFATLLKWFKKQVYLKVEDTSGATAPLFPVLGVITSMTQITTRTNNEYETIIFDIDKEEVT